MKTSLFFIIAILFLSITLHAQENVGIGTSSPDDSAILDIRSNDKGILIPRVNRENITNPAIGLLVFDDNEFYYNTNAGWKKVATTNLLTDRDNDTEITVEPSFDADRVELKIEGNDVLVLAQNANGDLLFETMSENVFLGNGSGVNATQRFSVGIGTGTLRDMAVDLSTTFASYNTAVGHAALSGEFNGLNNTGTQNSAFGYNAGSGITSGNSNTLIGTRVGERIDEGSGNTVMGADAGFSLTDQANNIFIGNQAGYFETGSNKLIIGIGTNGLIYGEMDNKLVEVRGDLSIDGNYTFPRMDGAINQVLTTDGAGNVTWEDPSGMDADADPMNEIQTISKINGTVTLSGGGGSFLDAVDDADADAMNELQTISKANGTVTLSNNGGSFTDEVDDADADAMNEIQIISKANGTVTLSNNGGSFTDEVNDADADAMNELQTISKANGIVTLSNNGGNFTDEVDDADADSLNELQIISKINGLITLSNGGGSITDEVNDADADSINELQFLTKVDSLVSLSNGGGSFTDEVDDDDADPENELISSVTVAGNVIKIIEGSQLFLEEMQISEMNDSDFDSKIELINDASGPDEMTLSLDSSIVMSVKHNDYGMTRLELPSTGNNLSIGVLANANNQNGIENISIGDNTLSNNISGFRNVAIGRSNMSLNETGFSNVSIGTSALQNSLSAQANIAIGGFALANGDVGSSNVAIGFEAGQMAAGNNNIFIGRSAGKMETGNQKLYVDANSSTEEFAFIYGEMDNQILKMNAKLGIGLGLTDPTHNFTVFSDDSETMRLYSNGLNGAGARLNFGDGDFVYFSEPSDDILRIQASRTGVRRNASGNAFEVEGNASKTTAGDWVANSDRRIKTDIKTIKNSFETMEKLRPVMFKYSEEWKTKNPSIKDQFYYNFIAQEYREVFPESVKGSGEYLDNDDEEIIQIDTYNAQIVTIQAVKDLIEENKMLKAKMESMNNENEALSSRMDQLEALIENLQN